MASDPAASIANRRVVGGLRSVPMIAEPVRAAAVAAEIDHKIRRVRYRAGKVFGVEIPAGKWLAQHRRGESRARNKTVAKQNARRECRIFFIGIS